MIIATTLVLISSFVCYLPSYAMEHLLEISNESNLLKLSNKESAYLLGVTIGSRQKMLSYQLQAFDDYSNITLETTLATAASNTEERQEHSGSEKQISQKRAQDFLGNPALKKLKKRLEELLNAKSTAVNAPIKKKPKTQRSGDVILYTISTATNVYEIDLDTLVNFINYCPLKDASGNEHNNLVLRLALGGHYELLKKLFSNGHKIISQKLDLTITNNNGKTVFDIIQEYCDPVSRQELINTLTLS